MTDKGTTLRIEALYIYPVKSLAGISVDQATATQSGLVGDRQWAIIKADRHPLTQRQNPRMALIQPAITTAGITLCAEGYDEVSINIPLENRTDVHVWKDLCPARSDTAKETSAWLKEVLQENQELTLATLDPEHTRRFHHPERFNIRGRYFSDAAPYLLCNSASLAALNTESAAHGLPEVDIRQFRPNIVVSGIPPFDEHSYQRLTSKDGTQFTLIDHCQRCAMITVDPDTGTFLPKAHPFKTLSTLNTMPDSKAPAFGVNTTLEADVKECVLTIGQCFVPS